jgi:uncharacterized protein (TIGR03437 family)
MRLLFLLVSVGAISQAQPVVLINGFQAVPCENATAESTFGQLPQKLRDAGREVIFFNNCSVPATTASRATIEEMGAALSTRLAAVSAAQVDVVMHSMGGLILRSYLSGKQNASGVFRPPATHKIRKAVFLGTPHFGPGFASLINLAAGSDPQVRQLLPGSQFMLDLNTWNQGGDDLRGVDALSVIGNAAPVDNVNNGGDGVVPLSSGSVLFAAGDERNRVVPMCHTDAGPLQLLTSTCRPPFLANVNGDDHLSWRIIRSFLTGTEEWRTLGTALSRDAVGGARGGVLVNLRDKDDNAIGNASGVTVGATVFSRGSAFFYNAALPSGAQNLSIATPSGTSSAMVTIAAGATTVATIKPGPWAVAALPAAGRVPTRTLAPGMFVSIYGAALASSSTAASSLPLPTTLSGTQVLSGTTALGLQFAGPTQINAILPENATGLVTLEVKSAAGAHKMNVLIEPAVPAIFTQTGTGAGAASAIQALSGSVVTAGTPAKPGDVISLYLTGLGATETRDGLQWARATPKLYLGSVEAQVLYAGRAPGFAGLDQINFIVPVDTPRGESTPLRVESSGRVSNAVTLPIL